MYLHGLKGLLGPKDGEKELYGSETLKRQWI